MNKLISKKVVILIFSFTIITVVSCKKEIPIKYSFFVAGHVYGKPDRDTLGFHPPFKEEFDFIRSYPEISFGVLTGDIVQHSNAESWDVIDFEIEELGLPIFFAPGNHDVYNYKLYKQRYGDPEYNYRTFRYFNHQDDLFIILYANIVKWNISGEQLDFLKDVLNNNKGVVKNVFVFVHQPIWLNQHTVFKNIKHNWHPLTPDTTNYWRDMEPDFQDYPAPVYIFTGDLGANKGATPYMYFKDSNITYIGGGMGSGINDNYIFVSKDMHNVIHFDLIALQGDRNRFGRLEDYVLP